MNLHCIGMNHRTAPIDVRERLWFSEKESRVALAELKANLLRECVLLSTCNRTELYGVAASESLDGNVLKEYLIQFKKAEDVTSRDHFYRFIDSSAANHLFKVASGIDSMVVGDIQILGQIKDAFNLAVESGTAGLFTNRLFQTAFRVGKRSKSETEISEGAVSISYAAVELANKIFADLSKKNALLIGVGKTGELTAKHLLSKNIGQLFVANRTRSKTEELVQKLGGVVIDFERILQELKHVDIVITSTGSPTYILRAEELRDVMRERSNEPMFIIDIAVPRDVDPAANKIENVFLHDIDALNLIVDKNLGKRKAEIPKVEKIILEELTVFYQWYHSLKVSPTIQELQEMFEEIRREEVEKHKHRFAPDERESIDILTKRIINKILHTPIINLKDGEEIQSEETMTKLSILRNLFGLSRSEKIHLRKGQIRQQKDSGEKS